MSGVMFFCGLIVTYMLAYIVALVIAERVTDGELNAYDYIIAALQAIVISVTWPLSVPLVTTGLLGLWIFTKYISKNRKKTNA